MSWRGATKVGFCLVVLFQLSCHGWTAVNAAPLSRCVDQILTTTSDNKLVLFIDGAQVTGPQWGNASPKTHTAQLHASARVIAINVEHGGLFLLSSGTVVTDGTWKCTDRFHEGWQKVNFDDSSWKAATVVDPRGIKRSQGVDGIRADASWIKVSSGGAGGFNKEEQVYCRKSLVGTCLRKPNSRENPPCNGTGPSCITSCTGKLDGDYQSCRGCQVYASCTNGFLIDDRPCYTGLYWDDMVKRCEWESTTCVCQEATPIPASTTKATNAPTEVPSEPTSPAHPPCSGTGPTCITSCSGLANGEYQSCKGCHVYASCTDGILTDGRSCEPSSLFWDDKAKLCKLESTTCFNCHETTSTGAPTSLAPTEPHPEPSSTENPPCSGTGPTCITSCTGLANGDYQSCKGCHVYASCADGVMTDGRSCEPSSLFWDDRGKQCARKSTTCFNCHETRPTAEPTTIVPTKPHPEPSSPANPPCSGTGPTCITSCIDLANGNYQSCKGCHVYASCANGVMTDGRSCEPSNLFWDDRVKLCARKSTTCFNCHEIAP